MANRLNSQLTKWLVDKMASGQNAQQTKWLVDNMLSRRNKLMKSQAVIIISRQNTDEFNTLSWQNGMLLWVFSRQNELAPEI